MKCLFKVGIQAIPSYIKSILRLLKNFCKSISSAIGKFWWNSGSKRSGIHWKNWDLMCNPKRKGGIGFKNFQYHNSSLLSKQAWRFHQNPHAYCARTLKSICSEMVKGPSRDVNQPSELWLLGPQNDAPNIKWMMGTYSSPSNGPNCNVLRSAPLYKYAPRLMLQVSICYRIYHYSMCWLKHQCV